MWHSKYVEPYNWVSVIVEFPESVTLNKMRLYSGHSGTYHQTSYAKIAYRNDSGVYMSVADTPTPFDWEELTFPAQTAKVWKLGFRTGSSGYVVIRGVRFYGTSNELIMP